MESNAVNVSSASNRPETIGWRRLSGYLSCFGFFILLLISFIQAFTYPMLGLMMTLLQYDFYEADYDPNGEFSNWIEKKDEVLYSYIIFLICVVILYTSTASGYGCVGENFKYYHSFFSNQKKKFRSTSLAISNTIIKKIYL